MVDHDFQARARTRVLTELVEDRAGMWRVVNHAKGIDQVVRLDGEKAAELLRISWAEADAILQTENGCALPRQLHRFL